MKTPIITFFLLSLISFNAQTQDAAEISKKSMDAIDIGNMEMTSTIIISDGKGNNRTRQITTASKQFGEANKMIIRFMAPADVKGTALLVYDYDKKSDDMWIYMPAMRKVRRVISTEKGKNFMGSEFTNADMSKPNFDDFNYKLLCYETLNGNECSKIESECKTADIANEYGFAKRISYIDKNTYLCYKVEYYNTAGKLHRIQSISNYKKQPNGKYFAYNMKMENTINGRKSEMKIDKFQAGSQLPESAFAPVNLDK